MKKKEKLADQKGSVGTQNENTLGAKSMTKVVASLEHEIGRISDYPARCIGVFPACLCTKCEYLMEEKRAITSLLSTFSVFCLPLPHSLLLL